MLVAHIYQYGIKLVSILKKMSFANIERQGSKYTTYWIIHQFLTNIFFLKNAVIHAKLRADFTKHRGTLRSDKIANIR